jgi:hypothetical protein
VQGKLIKSNALFPRCKFIRASGYVSAMSKNFCAPDSNHSCSAPFDSLYPYLTRKADTRSYLIRFWRGTHILFMPSRQSSSDSNRNTLMLSWLAKQGLDGDPIFYVNS